MSRELLARLGAAGAGPEDPAAPLIFDLGPDPLAAGHLRGPGHRLVGRRRRRGRPGKTVAVVGDGAVGLMAVLAARRLGAERAIAMSRHPERQELARYYGATDIVAERGDDGIAKIKDMTNGLGAHSVVEAVGTQQPTM